MARKKLFKIKISHRPLVPKIKRTHLTGLKKSDIFPAKPKIKWH